MIILKEIKKKTWYTVSALLPFCMVSQLRNPMSSFVLVIKKNRASLVAQWLRICLPMQGTRVRALVWEDPTCRGATGPVSHNY